MVVSTQILKDICNKALKAVDSNALSPVTETLELLTHNKELWLNITNKEYYLRIKTPIEGTDDLHAAVNANSFLKLITQTTTQDIELFLQDNNLVVKGNGLYKIPLVYDNDHLLELPEIKITNVTTKFNLSTDILKSILTYNSKELTKGFVTRPVQKLYYVDSKGAITFTNSACVNTFVIPEDVKLLLNNRLVKLFSLFTSEEVIFTMGQETLTDGSIQTRVSFCEDNIELSAILTSDDSLINSVPVEAIRQRSVENYPYTISILRTELLQTINRISLFTNKIGDFDICYCIFKFSNFNVCVEANNGAVKELIKYKEELFTDDLTTPYESLLDIEDIKSVLETFTEPYINISFGNDQAIVISSGNIKNIIPQCEE